LVILELMTAGGAFNRERVSRGRVTRRST